MFGHNHGHNHGRSHGRHHRGLAMMMAGRFGGFGRGEGPDGGMSHDGMGGGGWGGRGGHRRGKRFAGEELKAMVLALLAEEPRHGYDLIRAFAARSGDAYQPSPGVLYPLLTLLDEMGLIAAEGEAGAKRSFTLTPEGQAARESTRELADGAFARLAAMADEAGRGAGAAPIRRAMLNLRTAAVQRLGRNSDDNPADLDDLAFRVAAILDEAAQKIERL